MAPPDCPDPRRLEGHLGGTLAATAEAELVAHLDTCVQCQQTLVELAARNGPLLAVARGIGAGPAPSPALWAALEGLLDVAPARAVSLDPGEVAALLGLARVPGHLGRLGDYEVLEVVGRGGMGIVLKAYDEKLRRAVAIKVMAPRLAAHPATRERFRREGRAAAAIRNEHVIDIHAVDEADGLPFLVMEYLDGVSLQERLDAGTPFTFMEIARVGRAVALGLAEAHGQGVIHRDIKPANILLEAATGKVKITDFGLARAVDDSSLTQPGVVAGTPQYMSPEQARAAAVDARADLFSLGSVLYALCTGRPPFGCDGSLAILKRLAEETPRPIRELNPGVPDWLAALIGRLLAKDPAQRWQTAAEVAEALGQEPTARPAATVRPAAAPPRTRYGRAVVAACLLLGCGLAAYLFGGTLIRVATNQGLLVIQTEGPDVVVKVKGAEVTILDTKTKRQMSLKAGTYALELTETPAGLKLSTTEFTLERGDKEIVRVRLERTVSAAAWRRLDHDGAHAVAFSADSRRVLSGGGDAKARLWDVASNAELQTIDFEQPHGKNYSIYCVAIAPSGRRALAGSRDGRIWHINLDTGTVLQHWDHPPTPGPDGYGATSLAISPDGREALLGSFDGLVRVWDLEQGKERTRFQHGRGLWTVAYAPDGRQALTGGGPPSTHLSLWDLKTGKELHRRERPGSYRAVFSPDGRLAASGHTDKQLRLWKLDAFEETRSLVHPRTVTGICFTPDGNRLVAACEDGTVRLWDVSSGRELHQFSGPAGEARGVAVSPDGNLVAAACGRDGIQLWKLPK